MTLEEMEKAVRDMSVIRAGIKAGHPFYIVCENTAMVLSDDAATGYGNLLIKDLGDAIEQMKENIRMIQEVANV